jgi:hypothetical protein
MSAGPRGKPGAPATDVRREPSSWPRQASVARELRVWALLRAIHHEGEDFATAARWANDLQVQPAAVV